MLLPNILDLKKNVVIAPNIYNKKIPTTSVLLIVGTFC